MTTRIAIAICALAFPVEAVAQDAAQHGTANFTDYSTIINQKTMTVGKDVVTNYEVNGVSKNDDGGKIFNNMAIRCMGSSVTTNGDTISRGLCTHTDKDGDQIYINYNNTSHAGSPYKITEQLTGGTGKYIGISGVAESMRQIIKGPEGLLMIVLPHHVTWSRQ